MKKNQRKTFYYLMTIMVALMGFLFASNFRFDEIVVRGFLGGTVLFLVAFYVTHTSWDYSFGVSFDLLSFLKSMLLLFVFAIVVSWSIDYVLTLFFYITGI